MSEKLVRVVWTEEATYDQELRIDSDNINDDGSIEDEILLDAICEQAEWLNDLEVNERNVDRYEVLRDAPPEDWTDLI